MVFSFFTPPLSLSSRFSSFHGSLTYILPPGGLIFFYIVCQINYITNDSVFICARALNYDLSSSAAVSHTQWFLFARFLLFPSVSLLLFSATPAGPVSNPVFFIIFFPQCTFRLFRFCAPLPSSTPTHTHSISLSLSRSFSFSPSIFSVSRRYFLPVRAASTPSPRFSRPVLRSHYLRLSRRALIWPAGVQLLASF